jgi:hypothetical protein
MMGFWSSPAYFDITGNMDYVKRRISLWAREETAIAKFGKTIQDSVQG